MEQSHFLSMLEQCSRAKHSIGGLLGVVGVPERPEPHGVHGGLERHHHQEQSHRQRHAPRRRRRGRSCRRHGSSADPGSPVPAAPAERGEEEEDGHEDERRCEDAGADLGAALDGLVVDVAGDGEEEDDDGEEGEQAGRREGARGEGARRPAPLPGRHCLLADVTTSRTLHHRVMDRWR
jgi:hypothetical protein